MDLREQLQQTMGDAYTIERELGGGGMSRVFVATERALGRQVVVKVLPAEMSGQVSVDRFKREIALAAQLQHPHIVPFTACGVPTEGILRVRGWSGADSSGAAELTVPPVGILLRDLYVGRA